MRRQPAALVLYVAPLVDGDPGAALAVPAPFNDGLAQGDLTFSPDRSSALFWSIRGGSREPDLFLVRRTGDGWSTPLRPPAPYNAPGMDFTPSWSADGKTLHWASQRPASPDAANGSGAADLYAAPAAALQALAGA